MAVPFMRACVCKLTPPLSSTAPAAALEETKDRLSSRSTLTEVEMDARPSTASPSPSSHKDTPTAQAAAKNQEKINENGEGEDRVTKNPLNTSQ